MHRVGERPHHQRFGEPRNALQQAVASSKDGDNQLLDHRVLPNDRAGHLPTNPPYRLNQLGSPLKILVGCDACCWVGHVDDAPENRSPAEIASIVAARPEGEGRDLGAHDQCWTRTKHHLTRLPATALCR
jgi:hypothetical protein